MVRRVFYTTLFVMLAGCAFVNADPTPDVNLFGVMFLFFGYVVWFYWEDIQAGYACWEDGRASRFEGTGLMFIRFAPFYLRELVGKKRNRA